MKKITLVLSLIFGVFGALMAQEKVKQKVAELEHSKVTFHQVSILNEDSSIENELLETTVSNAVYGVLNTNSLQDIVTNKYEYLEIEVPYVNEVLVAKVYRVDVLADAFKVETSSGNKVNYTPGVYYRGVLNNEESSLVSFNFFENELNGIIAADRLGNVVVGKLLTEGNTTDYIVYANDNLAIPNDFECATEDTNYREPDTNEGQAQKTTLDTNSNNCVTMYFEVDNDLYLANGSNITTATNWITSVANNAETLYSNSGITTALRSTFIWDTQDPYTGTNSSESLNQFYQYREVFDADIGQLIGIDPGGQGGLAATINGLCSQYNRAYSDLNFSYNTVPTYSWTVQVITHEFGHVMGSRHTHACVWNGNNTAIDGCGQQAGYNEGSCDEAAIPPMGGTIMSYCHLISGVGISFNLGFGFQPSQAIINAINSANCLSSDCISTCINTVSNIALSTVSETSATITWDYLGSGGQWEVAVAPYPFFITASNYVTVNTNSYFVDNLNPNSYYLVRVRPICTSGMIPSNSSDYFATDADVCTGFVFTDMGGANANYGNNQYVLRTFVPAVSGQAARLDFTSFALELDWDYMYVYDGADTSAPLLTPNGLTGYSIPGPFVSTAADGSLTVEFISDGYVVDDGWEANVSCENAMGLATDSKYIDYSYYPNPTTGKVTIDARNVINKITVHNAAGQLLYSALPENTSVNVDLAKFATGTYFFSMEVEGVQTHFKVVKY